MDQKSHDEGYRKGYVEGFHAGQKSGIKKGADDYMQGHILTSAILILIAVAIGAYFIMV